MNCVKFMNNSILIKNIYYMLTYAFNVLKENNYQSICGEKFDRIEDLFAEILNKALSQQVKQGLYKEYVSLNEDKMTLKGKLNINNTIRNRIKKNISLNCDYDELSENNLFNQIIKTTILNLISLNKLDNSKKKELKRLLVYFDNIDVINLSIIKWNTLIIQRSNKTYRMLMNICYFIYSSLIQTQDNGKHYMLQFTDDKLATLYEHFILNYYKLEHKELIASSPYINWNLDETTDYAILNFLPKMKSDIMIQTKDLEKTLIIDAKFYSKTMQTFYERETFRNNNLYQIFTYVKNYDKNNSGNVSGMLLYAQSEIKLNDTYDFSIGGNTISVRTLNLNQDFEHIRNELDIIAFKFVNE